MTINGIIHNISCTKMERFSATCGVHCKRSTSHSQDRSIDRLSVSVYTTGYWFSGVSRACATDFNRLVRQLTTIASNPSRIQAVISSDGSGSCANARPTTTLSLQDNVVETKLMLVHYKLKDEIFDDLSVNVLHLSRATNRDSSYDSCARFKANPSIAKLKMIREITL